MVVPLAQESWEICIGQVSLQPISFRSDRVPYVMHRIVIVGGGAGGYTSARKEIIDLLRQRSRPYLFSNSLPPPIVAASLKAIELLQRSTELRDKLEANTKYFRAAMTDAGFNIVPGQHPITPIMLGDAVVAAKMAEKMLEKGVYVIGFSFPVVPQGKARIRTQVSAAHSRADLEFAVKAFTEVKREMNL